MTTRSSFAATATESISSPNGSTDNDIVIDLDAEVAWAGDRVAAAELEEAGLDAIPFDDRTPEMLEPATSVRELDESGILRHPVWRQSTDDARLDRHLALLARAVEHAAANDYVDASAFEAAFYRFAAEVASGAPVDQADIRDLAAGVLFCGGSAFAEAAELTVAFSSLGHRIGRIPGVRLPAVQPSHAPRSETEGDDGWDPVDVGAVLADELNARIEATVLRRADGVGLLYAGHVNWFSGEPESLKSWLALVACVQELEAERHVVYIDLEDNARSVILKRLHRDLGVDAARLTSFFHYIRPDGPITTGGTRSRLLAAAAAWGPSLAVIDGVTEALSLHGLSSKSDVDIASLAALLMRPLADAGPAVLPIDHVVKDPEQRGRWPIGSQHKLASVGGAAYGIHSVQVARRGTDDGLSRVVVVKDRQGEVRAHASAGGIVADFHFGSSDAGRVSWRLVAPEAVKEVHDFRPTHLMERVSRWLEGQVAERSQNEIVASVTGKERAILAAVRCLVAEGFVATNTGPRGAKLHRSTRPFREDGDE